MPEDRIRATSTEVNVNILEEPFRIRLNDNFLSVPKLVSIEEPIGG